MESLSYYSMLFHVIPSHSALFHAILCYPIILHVIPCHSMLFQAVPFFSTLFHLSHAIPWYSILFRTIPRYSIPSHAIPLPSTKLVGTTAALPNEARAAFGAKIAIANESYSTRNLFVAGIAFTCTVDRADFVSRAPRIDFSNELFDSFIV